MTKKVTGDTLIDTAIAKLNKTFSRDFISSSAVQKNIKPTPTGSFGLDLAIGIGGYPVGRVIEIYGLNSSGKTSLALAGAGQWLKNNPDRHVAIVDAEYTITEELLNGFGLTERLVYIRPDNASEALQATIDLVKTGRIGFLVFDSIDALQTEAALNKDITAADVGGVSKPLNRFFREYSKVATNTDCTSIFVNQLKYNPSVMFGSGKTTPGGTALLFYASLRIESFLAKPSTNNKNAFKMKLKIIKNKCAPPRDKLIEFEFIYARGPDPYTDILNVAKSLGVVITRGPNTYWSNDDLITSGGGAGWTGYMKENPDMLNRVRELCLAKIQSSPLEINVGDEGTEGEE